MLWLSVGLQRVLHPRACFPCDWEALGGQGSIPAYFMPRSGLPKGLRGPCSLHGNSPYFNSQVILAENFWDTILVKYIA
jgi:hypothetical protein